MRERAPIPPALKNRFRIGSPLELVVTSTPVRLLLNSLGVFYFHHYVNNASISFGDSTRTDNA